jgi:hypothetical protein
VADELTGLRLAAQLIADPQRRSPHDVVTHLLAVQAQDLRGARLAIRVRSLGLAASDVDHALTEERSLLVTWLNRGTLHLVAAEDYWWLQALTTPQIVPANARRLGQEGVSATAAERGVQVIVRALAGGPLTRKELRTLVAAAGVPVEGQAMVHLLMLASLRGFIVRGPVLAGGEQAFVLVRDWLGQGPKVDRRTALGELALRYLRGHGPATDADLARWAKLPLRDARAGLAKVGDRLIELAGGLVDVAPGRRPSALPPPRLLGPFDPVLLGWRDRDDIVAGATGLVTTNGLFRPFALVDGRAAALWSLAGGEVTLSPLRRLTAKQRAALDAEAVDVLRFLAN